MGGGGSGLGYPVFGVPLHWCELVLGSGGAPWLGWPVALALGVPWSGVSLHCLGPGGLGAGRPQGWEASGLGCPASGVPLVYILVLGSEEPP